MALCKDCFHREVCEFLATGTTINLDDIPPEIPCSYFKDTADVVPKSEVEELTRENESLAKTVNEASELIRKLRSKIAELKKKYTEDKNG